MNGNQVEGVLGLVMVMMVIIAAMLLVLRSEVPRVLKMLVITAIGVRIAGSVAYLETFDTLYGGGDYRQYYSRGVEYADRLWRADLAMVYDSREWRGERWWGTQFVFLTSGLIASLTGPNILAVCIVFSLLAFSGLVGFAVSFRSNFPEVPVDKYVKWIWLFPSLWFWSAAVGKDALLLCGFGLATVAVARERVRINWALSIIGIGVMFAVRPQVAAVVVFSIILAQWATQLTRWTIGSTIQSVLVLAVGLALIQVAMSTVGAGGLDAEGVESYVDRRAAQAVEGGTAVEGVREGWTRAPLGAVNVLFRPFPWEAQSATGLVASIEVWILWATALVKRRNIIVALRSWRSKRLLTFAIVFIVLYSAALGMTVVNLGIIARQRTVLFFEACPAAATPAKVVRVRQRSVYDSRSITHPSGATSV